jgi:hypothetical protein
MVWNGALCAIAPNLIRDGERRCHEAGRREPRANFRPHQRALVGSSGYRLWRFARPSPRYARTLRSGTVLHQNMGCGYSLVVSCGDGLTFAPCYRTGGRCGRCSGATWLFRHRVSARHQCPVSRAIRTTYVALSSSQFDPVRTQNFDRAHAARALTGQFPDRTIADISTWGAA